MLPILTGLLVGTPGALVGHWAETGPRGLVGALALSLRVPPSARRAPPSQHIWAAGVQGPAKGRCSRPRQHGVSVMALKPHS